MVGAAVYTLQHLNTWGLKSLCLVERTSYPRTRGRVMPAFFRMVGASFPCSPPPSSSGAGVGQQRALVVVGKNGNGMTPIHLERHILI